MHHCQKKGGRFCNTTSLRLLCKMMRELLLKFLSSSDLKTTNHYQCGSHDAVAATWPALPRTTMCSSWHCRQIVHTCRHFAASMHALIHLFFINRISVLGLTRTRRGICVSVISTISKGLSRVPPRLRISMICTVILAVELSIVVGAVGFATPPASIAGF